MNDLQCDSPMAFFARLRTALAPGLLAGTAAVLAACTPNPTPCTDCADAGAAADGGVVDAGLSDAGQAHDAGAVDAGAFDAGHTDFPVPTGTGIRDVRTAIEAGETTVSLTVDDVYVTSVRSSGYTLQRRREGPAVFVYAGSGQVPAGLAVGNKLSINVHAVSRYRGLDQITDLTVAANDGVAHDVVAGLSQDLSAGAGTILGEDTESELVRTTGTLIGSTGSDTWTLRYGSDALETSLYAPDAEMHRFCNSAEATLLTVVHSFDDAYSLRMEGTGDPLALDRSACAGYDAGPALDAGSADAGPGVDAGPVEIAYWNGFDTTASGAALVTAVTNKLASTHNRVSYDDLYDAYADVDGQVPGCDGVFDIYSDTCWTLSEKCGNARREGDCFNREHVWAKSWWGGSQSGPRFSDLHHVLASDGFINNRRGSLPFGEVDPSDIDYQSSSGARVGSCVNAGTNGNCFSPPPSTKGDIARAVLYFAVRYRGMTSCCDREGVNGSYIDPWMEAELRAWHAADPVSERERVRNNRAEFWQGNRNPFVDYPGWVDRITDF